MASHFKFPSLGIAAYLLAALLTQPAVSDAQELADIRVENPLLAGPSSRVDDLATRSLQLKQIIKQARLSVVHIEAIKADRTSTNNTDTFTEAGAGVIFEYHDKYFVLTNLHVVKDAEVGRISILLNDGRFFRPLKILSDADTDIAVLPVDFGGLQACKIGDSDEVETGDFAFAIGSPFGLHHSVTYGIVSARSRRNLELGEEGVKYQDFIQTDAAINPGNSGGPLINLKGEVIGINTAIASNSGGNDGIGFSIPIKMALRISKQLIDDGKVTRAFLGVTLDSEFTVEKAARLGMERFYGARVTKVTHNSPAYRAGMETNDLILQFNGVDIQDDAHLVNVVSSTPTGSTVSVMVMRDHKTMTLSAVLQGTSKP